MELGDWPTWLGVTLTLVGLVVAYTLGRHNKQKPQLRVGMDEGGMLEPKDSLVQGGLKLTFAGREIQRAYISLLAIWNHRGDTIRGTDAVEADPLRLQFQDDDPVLQVRVVSESRSQIQFNPSVDEAANSVRLNFDFLDARDGAIVEVIHQQPVFPMLKGTIRGTTIRRARRAHLDKNSRENLRKARFHRLLGPGPWYLRSLVVLGLVGTITYVGIIALTVTVFTGRMGTAELLDSDSFDLSTLAGQAEFASKVSSVGLFDEKWTIVGAALLLLSTIMLFFTVAVVVRYRRPSGIPESIVQNEFELSTTSGAKDNSPGVEDETEITSTPASRQ